MSRPTLAAINTAVSALVNQLHHCPKTSNKGAPGMLLERLTGIPTSSALLDAEDGEVKLFPVKTLRNGTRVPKETVAVTMLNPDALRTTCFEESHCAAKLRRVLFVPYIREGENIRILAPTLFTSDTHAELYAALAADYVAIQNEWVSKGEFRSTTGTLLQNRTKGPGGKAKKTRAFFLRSGFLKTVVPL